MESQVQALSFPLTNTLSRQIFEYQSNGTDCLMMYDSGAQIPVWCRSLEKLKNLAVAVLFKPFIGCDFLLSETMLSKVDTLTTRRNKRELQIIFDRNNRPFICTVKMRQQNIIQGIAVWTQTDEI